mmetsp:Transcript_57963/g.152662  ORF Transcript_57963/g.152662 Transcript_57963/m.152662 type:complete len:297 (-) Transcript_57963:19-909(-)
MTMDATQAPAGMARSRAPAGAAGATNPQARNLDRLGEKVAETGHVFEEVARGADDGPIAEQMEEVVRKIKKERAHYQQQAKHLVDTTKSYSARFEHVLKGTDEALEQELRGAVSKVEDVIDAANARLAEVEEALAEQHRMRLAHAEANLGPLRDQANALVKALDQETRARRLMEERREKSLTDEVEAINKLIDEEKFSREQQLMEFTSWANAAQQNSAKKQYQVEKETRAAVDEVRTDHQKMAHMRIESQHRIVESIGAFVSRFRGHMSKEAEAGLRDLDMIVKLKQERGSDDGEN